MPLILDRNINESTKFVIWNITEDEDFFIKKVANYRLISHPAKRLQHLAGRYLLQYADKNFPVNDIVISDSDKPILLENDYKFSISHSNQFATAIISKSHNVGIDIEKIKDRIDHLFSKYLSDFEKNLFSDSEKNNYGIIFWSVKEAIYKWHGERGIDFLKHINITSVNGNLNEGIVEILFLNKSELFVKYLFIENHYVSWIVN